MKHTGSQAELRGSVRLLPYKLLNLDICELKIVCGKETIHTDQGCACLDISRFPINYGSHTGRTKNSQFLSGRIFKAVEKSLAQHTFQVGILLVDTEVRFVLRAQHLPEALTLPKYFVTSKASFAKAGLLLQADALLM